MRSAHYERLQPVLAEGEAMLRVAERVGRFAIREEKALPGSVGGGFPRRHRDAMNAHSGYFRAILFGGQSRVAGVESFVENTALVEAARHLYGRPLVRPVAASANLMLPGQQVALHTDVPEFRGIRQGRDPAWLSVAMHHSGLFDDWRIACATGVAWFGGEPQGGDFVFYPDGPYRRSVAVPVRHDTAIALDTDSVFHSVDRLARVGPELPSLTAGMALRYGGDGAWVLDDGKREIARYAWSDLRFSVSWRAHCYCDGDEERKVREHKRDLSRERVLEVLTDDLRAIGRIGESAPDAADLAQAIVGEYVKLPPGAPSATSAN
jgi:hypothetical protein